MNYRRPKVNKGSIKFLINKKLKEEDPNVKLLDDEEEFDKAAD